MATTNITGFFFKRIDSSRYMVRAVRADGTHSALEFFLPRSVAAAALASGTYNGLPASSQF